MTNKHYYLSWEHYTQQISKNLLTFFKTQQFVDLTLSCDGHTIGVHKCVLAAASSYFQTKFIEHPHADLIVIKSININILRGLVHFLYHGGVYISSLNLNKFLQAANYFKFHGLCGIETQILSKDTLKKFNEITLESPEFIVQEKVVAYNDIDEFPMVNGEYNYSENEIFIPDEHEHEHESIDAEQSSNVENPLLVNEEIIKKPDKVLVENVQIIENYCKSNTKSKEGSTNNSVLTVENDRESDKALKILEEAGVPTDVPIYCEGNDGNFVELTNDLLQDIASGGQIIYQVIDEEGKPSELRFGGPINCGKSNEAEPKDLISQTPNNTTEESLSLKNKTDSGTKIEVSPKVTVKSPTIKSDPINQNILKQGINVEPKDKIVNPTPIKIAPNNTTQEPLVPKNKNDNPTKVEISPKVTVKSPIVNVKRDPINPNIVKKETNDEPKDKILNTPIKIITRIRKPPASNSDFIRFDIRKSVKKDRGVTPVPPKSVQKKDNLLKKNEPLNTPLNHSIKTENSQSTTTLDHLKRHLAELQHPPTQTSLKTEKDQKDHTNEITLVQRAALKRKQILEAPTGKKRKISELIVMDKRKTRNGKRGGVQSKGKDIPYALGLLPLQKALRKIQDTPDHTPRSTRSNLRQSLKK